MLTVALAFLLTWVIPNQILAAILITFGDDNDGMALKLRVTMSLGAFERQSFSITSYFAVITAQLNSCINFFIYAFRHKKFREHLRLACGADSFKTTDVVLNAKADVLTSAPK